MLASVSAFGALLEASALVALVPLASTIASGDGTYTARLLGQEAELAVLPMLALTAGLIVLRSLVHVTAGFLSSRICSQFEAKQRTLLFTSYMDADWDLQARELGGHLLDVMTSAAQRSAFALLAFCDALVALFSLLIMTAVAFVINPTASLLILLVIVALFFGLRPLSKLARRYSSDQRALNLAYAHAVTQYVGMTKEVRIFNVAEPVKDAMKQMVRRHERNRFAQYFLVDLLPAIYENFAVLTIIGGLAAVWWLDIGPLSSLAAIVLVLVRALAYSKTLQSAYHKYAESRPYTDLVRERLDQLQAARAIDEGDDIAKIDNVAFRNVSFSYLPGRPVLRDVSFESVHGEAIGIVGPSGAGKSTFVQVLLRLRTPDAGDVLVNSSDVTHYRLGSWFNLIGFVPQEPILLNTSVAENIRFFREGITTEMIERAARLAHVHEEIVDWPEGYETLVGERGGQISGGQRQRLCIARALVLQPDVLIFDEPTSSLDPHSEWLIQETLRSLRGSVTQFIVAHRLSTLNICDRIMVFDDGRLEAFAQRHVVAQDNEYYTEALRLSQLA